MGSNCQGKCVKLNSGHSMPIIGLGTFLIKEKPMLEKIISTALEAGYRSFDTGEMFGNEGQIGETLEALLPKYNLKRQDIFITSKLANYSLADKAEHAIEESLKRLKTDYLDLFMIHWPEGEGLRDNDAEIRDARLKSWAIMEKLQKAGKLKSLGVTNYNVHHLSEMLRPDSKHKVAVKPAVNQVEFHPYLYQAELLAYCKENGIVLQAYSSLGSEHSQDLMRDPTISSIAQKHKKSNGQVLLRWAIQHDVMVIPKSRKPERVKENIQIFDFSLDEADMKALDGLNKNIHYIMDPDNTY